MVDFTTFDIIKLLDIPRERLQDWMNRGFIKPSIQTAQGKGTKNIFSRYNVYGIELFKRLLDFGVNREVASKFVKHLIGFKFEPISGKSGGPFILMRRKDLEDKDGFQYSTNICTLTDGDIDYDIAWVINMKNIFEKIDYKIP